MERRRKRGTLALTSTRRGSRFRKPGLSLIAGAADDDPSAIGTYANVGARFGLGVLWLAPVVFPLKAVTVYLASKLGQVGGQGLAAAIRLHYSRWLLWTIVVAMLAGNAFEAAADLGGTAAALQLVVPAPLLPLIVVLAAGITAALFLGSYSRIHAVFRWLALALFAYAGAAALSRPNWRAVLAGSVIPRLHPGHDFWVMSVAVVGTSLSPYLYFWQTSQEVEEDVSMGRRRLSDRKGTTAAALRNTAWDMVLGMFFSSAIMYFIILATGATLYPMEWGQLRSAAEAAQALQPLAGGAAGALFAAGVIGVGFLAVPVMAVGAGYAVCDALGWKSGLTARPRDARAFYAVIGAVMLTAVAIDAGGLNPVRALVAAGVVQGLLAPIILLLLVLMTRNRAIVGGWVNGRMANAMGWIAMGLATLAALALIVASV